MYSNGKIYKLLCTDKHYYIGSTVSDLRFKIRDHKNTSSKRPDERVYKHINQLGWEHVSIQLIEDFPCNSKQELNTREDYHIELAKQSNDTLCLNFVATPPVANSAEMSSTEKLSYENGKIYTLICSDKYYYIGSTTTELRVRLNNHKCAAKKYPDRKVYNHICSIGWDKVSIKLLENYPCSSKTELNMREDYHIKKALDSKDKLCLNTTRPCMTAEEKREAQQKYVESNKEYINQRKREWARKKHEETADERAAASEAKREIRQEKSAARVARDRTIHTCDCGGSYQAYQKKRHMESKKHLAFLERGTSTTSEEYKTTRKRELQDYKNAWGRKKKAEVAAATADIRAAVKAEKRAKIAEQMEATRERVNEVHKCDCGGEYRIYQKKRHEGTAKHRAYAALTAK